MATALLMAATCCLGCHSGVGSCPGGACGLSSGGCTDGSCQAASAVEANGAQVNYLPNQGRGGPLAAWHGRFHRGPQSHTGDDPGPAAGPANPTYGYPYYTTRGPRDFLNPNPPSIGP
jgi:hypothetical protein